jgi:hypothetical protein
MVFVHKIRPQLSISKETMDYMEGMYRWRPFTGRVHFKLNKVSFLQMGE